MKNILSYQMNWFISACEHLIRHMLIIEPEKRLSLNQIESHKWMKQVNKTSYSQSQQHFDLVFFLHFQLTEPTTKKVFDVNPMMNTAVIELMLQLPGLDKDMIVNVCVFIYNNII